MNKPATCGSVTVLLVVATAAAQQVGTAARDYTINGLGSLAPSYVVTGIPTATGATIINRYSTQVSFAPVVWAAALAGTPGGFILGPNSIDIGTPALGLTDVVFLINGTNPGPTSALLTTGANNRFEVTVGVPGSVISATDLYLQFAHVTATSPVGFLVSQAHRLTVFTPPPIPTGPCPPNNGVTLPLPDDGWSVQNLGFNFTFYGQNFTQVTVCSNGSIAFGGTSATWGPQSELINIGFPIVHIWQMDLYPPGSTTGITFFTDGIAQARVQYINLPPCCQSYNGSNGISLCIDIVPSFISVRYTDGQSLASQGDAGIGPGVPVPQTLVDLSTSPTINPGESVYEPTPSDLWGHRLTWALDSAGQPAGAIYN